MLQVSNVTIQFGGKVLFKDANITFTKGNCYGVIGANGAGKSTFLKMLAKEIEPNKGDVILQKGKRISKLGQDHNAYDDKIVLDTVIAGHQRLTEIIKEKERLYNKENFSEQDGIVVGKLEEEFADLNGWEAESEATELLISLGINKDKITLLMKELDNKEKVRVLLAQALFGNPDVLLLDEPTNELDIKSIRWLENFLLNFENTVIIVAHDRHFLNKVCTHTLDVDFSAINLYMGNYEFWYESSQLIERQMREQNKKAEQRIKELEEFISRFSANLSKSRQATSRKKELDKINLNDLKPSNRRYPFIDFKIDREVGNDILIVENLTKQGLFENISFSVNKNDKIAFLCDNQLVVTALFNILMGLDTPDSGTFKWGITITKDYFPLNHQSFFEDKDKLLIDWIANFSKDQNDTFLRGWLGRLLFSKEDVFKKVGVLSGGEKVRCMLAKIMLSGANVILLDDPSNHLDLEAITSLNKGMSSFKGPLLFTSHDHEIINTVANRLIVINNTKTFDKNITYDEYLELI